MARAVDRGAFETVFVLLLLQAGLANWRSPLEIDEQVTYYIAAGRTPSSVYARATQQSATPPGYFWLVRGSLDLGRKLGRGTSEWWLRLPSLACYLATLLVVYRFGERFIAPNGGAAAALLLACHPLGIDKMALQARPYALGLLAAAAVLYTLRHLQVVGWSRTAFAAFVTANAILAWTHYLFVALWPVEVLLIVAPKSAARKSMLLGGLAIAGLSALPLLPAALRVQSVSSALAWITEPPTLRTFEAFGDPRALGIAAGIALILGLVLRNTPVRPAFGLGLWLLVAALGPALLIFGAAVGLGQPSLGQVRYILPALAATTLCIAWLLTVLSRGRGVLVATIMFVVAWNLPAGVWKRLQQPVWHDSFWKDAARLIREQAGDRDVLLVQPGLVEARLTPTMYADAGFQEYTTSRLSDFYLHRDLERLALPPFWSTEPADWQTAYAVRLAGAKNAGGKVWLICSADTDVGQRAEAAAKRWIESLGWKMTLANEHPVARVWRAEPK